MWVRRLGEKLARRLQNKIQMAITKVNRRLRIRKGIRSKISGTSSVPRFSVYRSNRAIYAQLINDEKGETLLAVSSKEVGIVSINPLINQELKPIDPPK